MTFDEFLQTPEALKYREENLPSMIKSLQEICAQGDYPIANNLPVLTALANQDIDYVLRNLYLNAKSHSDDVGKRILEIIQKNADLTNPNLQIIINKIMEEFQYTGIGVFNEIREMIENGYLKIDNDELDNDSMISVK